MKEKLWTRNFITSCIVNFLMAASFNLLMPTIPIYLTEVLQIEPSQIGFVLSSYVLALLIIRPFSGYIIDTFDRKKILLLSLFVFVAVFFGYLFAVTVIILVAVRFMHGLSWGMTTVASNTIAVDIIPLSRRAEGLGYFGINMNLAMALAPFVAMQIFDSFGFAFLIVCAACSGFAALIAAFFIKVPQSNVPEVRPARPPMTLESFIIAKSLPIFFNQILLTIGWGMLVCYSILYGRETGITNANLFFLFLALGMIAARVVSGKYVDRGYIHAVAIVSFVVICLSFFVFYSFQNNLSFCSMAFFIGAGYGMMLPAFQMLFINMAPSNRRGTANSAFLTAFDLGLGAGMLLGGITAELFSLKYIYLEASVFCFCAIFFYVFISRKVYDKNKLESLS